MLAIAAGVLCLTAFVVKYIRNNKIDYTVLIAGLFVLSFGFSSYYVKPRK